MQHLTNLFKLLEIARSMPQHGYAVSGLQKHELSDIAQHQYLVTLIAWQLAMNLNSLGASFNIQRVQELAMTHDLGELFGSDISFYYARKNRKARKFAKLFEEENIKFVSKLFGKNKAYFRKLLQELYAERTDEALLVKVADVTEAMHFKFHVGRFIDNDKKDGFNAVMGYAKKIKDTIGKRELLIFIKQWIKDLPKGDTVDVIKGV